MASFLQIDKMNVIISNEIENKRFKCNTMHFFENMKGNKVALRNPRNNIKSGQKE